MNSNYVGIDPIEIDKPVNRSELALNLDEVRQYLEKVHTIRDNAGITYSATIIRFPFYEWETEPEYDTLYSDNRYTLDAWIEDNEDGELADRDRGEWYTEVTYNYYGDAWAGSRTHHCNNCDYKYRVDLLEGLTKGEDA